MQISSDVEIVLDLPDKYLPPGVASGGGGMMVIAGGGVTGFNGDRPLQKLERGGMPGGRRHGDPHGRPGGAPSATARSRRRNSSSR